MDVGALRLVLAGVRADATRTSFLARDEHGEYGLIHALDALENRLQSVQQWLYSMDPHALADLRASLSQTCQTIKVALEKLQLCLIESRGSRSDCSPIDLARQQCRSPSKYWPDLRECVSLVDLGLKTLSLQVPHQPCDRISAD